MKPKHVVSESRRARIAKACSVARRQDNIGGDQQDYEVGLSVDTLLDEVRHIFGKFRFRSCLTGPTDLAFGHDLIFDDPELNVIPNPRLVRRRRDRRQIRTATVTGIDGLLGAAAFRLDIRGRLAI